MKRLAVTGENERVELLDGTLTRYINLDNAASTPALKKVMDRVNSFMPLYSSVHRGSGYKSRYSTKMYEQAREVVLSFFGGNPKDHVVIFGMNTSEVINRLAYSLDLKSGDVVVASMLEHHSNDLPWRSKAQIVRARSLDNGLIDIEDLKRLLNKHKGKVKLVAITGASNVTGHITDIDTVAQLAHQVGAKLLIDGAQLAPHRPIDMKPLSEETHIDYLAVSGHKMYAPFGTGALITRKDSFSDGAPLFSGGGTIDFVSLDEVIWADTPERDEVGSPNVVGVIAFSESLNSLSEYGMKNIVRHEQDLVRYAVAKLKMLPRVTLFGAVDEASLENRTGVISFTVDGINHALVAEILAAEYGVGVRSGCFCAHPYVIQLLGIGDKELKKLKSIKTAKSKKPIPGLVRISFGFYNTRRDIDIFLKGLRAIIAGEYKGKYEFDALTGEYKTRSWPKLQAATSKKK